jgi:2-keto-4-pentenoate hydratase/2-oxohepta-3-ene-1,7-dioic acid hydratase in catechol pathway
MPRITAGLVRTGNTRLDFASAHRTELTQKGSIMKLMRIGNVGEERAAVAVDESRYVDISDMVVDIDSDFFQSEKWFDIEAEVNKRISENQVHEIAGKRIGAPFARPHQIICIGLNYADHAKESGAEVPPEPIIFTKASNTLVGPNDTVIIPKNSEKCDWEVELGIVIGKRAKYLSSPAEAAEHIAGYVLCNDVSEREFQLERQGQWSKGKSCETFNPAGPWLVTRDELSDVSDLKMSLLVNGRVMQNSTSAQMVFKPEFLVYYLSQFMVLEPGDLINTGTPPGVGLGFKPPIYLKDGDVMHLEIEGLGKQTQNVVSYSGH